MNAEKYAKAVAKWLRENVEKAHAKGLVFGLSGGIDSAVCAGISKMAFGENALGLIMPIESLKEDEAHAELIAKKLDLRTKRVDLNLVFRSFKSLTNGEKSLALSNVKPRLRMMTLYYYAQSLNYLVLGCSNRSEFMTGYFTKFGDSGADLIPLADFLKSEIYDLGEYLGIPEEIMNKEPSAGLWEGQTDEKEMGVDYESIEKYILGKDLPREIFDKIDLMHKNSEHKRNFPPIFKKNE